MGLSHNRNAEMRGRRWLERAKMVGEGEDGWILCKFQLRSYHMRDAI